jgi:hypothetical protein
MHRARRSQETERQPPSLTLWKQSIARRAAPVPRLHKLCERAIGAVLLSLLRSIAPLRATAPRSLMPREIELLHRVFGDTIELGRVRVALGGPSTLGLPFEEPTPRAVGNIIYWPRRGHYAPWMTREGVQPGGEQTFIHEAAHVVQYQQRGAAYLASSLFCQIFAVLCGKTRAGAYRWHEKAARGVPWSRLGAEEQAHLIDEAFATRVDGGGRLIKDDVDFTLYARRALVEARAGRGWA